MALTRTQAETLLLELTQNQSLLRHMRTVALVMEAYARQWQQPEEAWYVAGLLHDADYEKYPDQHPNVIVAQLRQMGELELAHAIAAHYTPWGVPAETQMAKALLACDELTGFIVACSQVRPDGIAGLEARSVMKKLKDRNFAAKVDRQEIQKGMDALGVLPEKHIEFIVHTLRGHREALQL